MYCQAEQMYTNINTYAALTAQQHRVHPGSPLNSCLHSAFGVLAHLEYSPDTPRGDFGYLAVRAAAAWLMIAGKEIVELGRPSTNKHDYISGSLWKAEGGTDMVEVKRLQFWNRRFGELRDSGMLVSQEAVDAAYDAEKVLDDLIEHRYETPCGLTGST